jgi:hypothetical protein
MRSPLAAHWPGVLVGEARIHPVQTLLMQYRVPVGESIAQIEHSMRQLSARKLAFTNKPLREEYEEDSDTIHMPNGLQ